MELQTRSESRARVDAVRRLAWLAAGALLWAAFILAKLISLQVLHHDEYARLARQQQERLVEIPAPRGTIYDRGGQPLAMSVPMDSVFVNPVRVPDPIVASEILSRILDLDRDELYGRIVWARENHRGFLPVKRKISPEEAERLRSLRLEWIEFQDESQRHYPKGSVAAHVLGSVDHQEKGNGGLEFGLDRELRGHAGTERLLTDVKRRGIDSHLATQPQAGKSITLTIDERIQFAAERDLKNAVIEHRCKTGSLVVMNPHNGEILAMASYPTFDPNKPPAPGEKLSSRLNLAVSAPFEPGSVFKVITLAAALETTNLRPNSIINCGNGSFNLFGRVIHEAKHGYGSLPMAMVLAKSSNIGAIQIGLKVGERNLYDYVRSFGFGKATKIPLPAESAGVVRPLKRWIRSSIGSVAMGHEISTTTLQLAQACSVIANGGLLVKPKLVLKRGEERVPSAEPRRILRPETAITMRQMMEGVVISPGGTGRRARLEGYSSAGKTGSAQIFDPATRHYSHRYNASFIGFAPVANPAIVVVVTLNGSTGSAGFGGVVAAPVFRSVAQEALRVMDVPRDLPDEVPPEPVGTPQDLNDLAIAEAGDPVLVQEVLAEDVPEVEYNGPRVPNFSGKTMRAVLEESSESGLPVLLDGTGIALRQFPPAGAALHEGERIRVQFGR